MVIVFVYVVGFIFSLKFMFVFFLFDLRWINLKGLFVYVFLCIYFSGRVRVVLEGEFFGFKESISRFVIRCKKSFLFFGNLVFVLEDIWM